MAFGLWILHRSNLGSTYIYVWSVASIILSGVTFFFTRVPKSQTCPASIWMDLISVAWTNADIILHPLSTVLIIPICHLRVVITCALLLLHVLQFVGCLACKKSHTASQVSSASLQPSLDSRMLSSQSPSQGSPDFHNRLEDNS